MQWSDELRIETPEQIEVELELAGLGSRFVAQMVDWLYKGLATLALLLLLLMLMALLGAGKLIEDMPTIAQAAVVAGLYLLWLGYGLFFEVRWNGQTPGKRMAGIRVVRLGGAALDAQAAAIRNLLAIADFLPSFFLLGAVLILLTNRRQRLGDLAAGTVVVRERTDAVDDNDLADVLAEAPADQAFGSTALAALTANDRTVLRSFLQRYDDLDPESRDRLARKLAAQYQAKTGQPRTGLAGQKALDFLTALLRDVEQSRRVE